ncbi:MAG: hypothetical protein ACC619_08340 [Paracoccaceae bacterium]
MYCAFARSISGDQIIVRTDFRRRRKSDNIATSVTKLVMRELKGTTGRRLVRGILGGLFKGR